MGPRSEQSARDNGGVTLPERFGGIIGPGTAVRELAARLAARGHSCYLVGGPVRDLLLGAPARRRRPHHRRSARRDQGRHRRLGRRRMAPGRALRHGRGPQGRRGLRDHHVPRRRLRAGVAQARGDLRRSIEVDLGRRDFTVNAMALRLDVDDTELVDPYDGRHDLHDRVLRTPQTTEISFGDDPLRMLRAARFAATLGFEPADDVVKAMHDMRGRLEIVSAERVRDELSKLLLADDPGPGLWLVARDTTRRRVPARAEPDGARTGPDPPAQGRARAHDRRGAERRGQPRVAARGAAARRRQAEDARLLVERRDVPLPRRGRRAHGQASG